MQTMGARVMAENDRRRAEHTVIHQEMKEVKERLSQRLRQMALDTKSTDGRLDTKSTALARTRCRATNLLDAWRQFHGKYLSTAHGGHGARARQRTPEGASWNGNPDDKASVLFMSDY